MAGQQSVVSRNDDEVSHSVARIKAGVLALIFGFFGGAGLFAATAVLLIKGGTDVGKHLELLGHYFPGYHVSWGGAFVGMFYGALLGGLVGWVVGMIYNRIVGVRYR